MQPRLVPILGSNRGPSQPQLARKCAAALGSSPDFRMVYNRAQGIPACTAGRFPLKGNYTTTIQRPTLLGWAFSFARNPHQAGLSAILRV